MTHTPTPWKLDGFHIVDDNGAIIATCRTAYRYATQEEVSNAELIVKCVNSHDELLEACKGLLEAIKFSGWSIDDDRWQKPLLQAGFAIAKAEGR